MLQSNPFPPLLPIPSLIPILFPGHSWGDAAQAREQRETKRKSRCRKPRAKRVRRRSDSRKRGRSPARAVSADRRRDSRDRHDSCPLDASSSHERDWVRWVEDENGWWKESGWTLTDGIQGKSHWNWTYHHSTQQYWRQNRGPAWYEKRQRYAVEHNKDVASGAYTPSAGKGR